MEPCYYSSASCRSTAGDKLYHSGGWQLKILDGFEGVQNRYDETARLAMTKPCMESTNFAVPGQQRLLCAAKRGKVPRARHHGRVVLAVCADTGTLAEAGRRLAEMETAA